MQHYNTSPGFLKKILTSHWELNGATQVRWAALRERNSSALVGFVAGIPFTYRVGKGKGSAKFRALEVHSLFVSPKWRGRRLVPALVQRMVLHAIDTGIQFAVHTSVNRLPGNCPGSVTTYYSRPVNVRRAIELGAATLDKWVTKTDMLLAHGCTGNFAPGLRKKPTTPVENSSFRVAPTTGDNCCEAYEVYSQYISHFSVSPVVGIEEFAHRYTHAPPVTHAYAVLDKESGKVVGCFSYYLLHQAAASNGLTIAMSLFNAHQAALSQKTLLGLVMEQAHRDGVDMFYCMNNADNPDGFRRNLFQRCEGNDLYYYFYNVRLNKLIPPSQLGLSLP